MNLICGEQVRRKIFDGTLTWNKDLKRAEFWDLAGVCVVHKRIVGGGIGISFGSGMVNICYAMYGNPIFAFSLVNSGDWIDRQAAKATGETISFINKEKTKTDLTKAPTTLVERAIHTQYRLMVEHTVSGIKKGFSDITKTVRTDMPLIS